MKNISTQVKNLFTNVQVVFLLLWILCISVLPELILVVTILNLILFSFILALRYFSVLLPYKVPQAKTLATHPKVTVHVPTYNEPPEVVINTLKALTRLDYENYEVIVLDNNTKEEHIWKPVQDFCQHKLGDNFYFYHYDKLEGFKAGALNVCLEKTAKDAEYILVIDADYQVKPHLLKEAIGFFHRPEVGLVQFPQAYYNASENNLGLQSEYEHFFSVYMNMANHYDCVLSTGTVSVIKRKALEKAGGWQDQTITEDVELGLRLKHAGYRGVYVPKPLGRGLMPTDIEALRTQRERWIYGNMQTLKLFFRTFSRTMNVKQTLGILAMLTAWYNFLCIPLLALITSVIASLFSNSEVLGQIQMISLGSVWYSILGTFLFFLIAFMNRQQPTKNAVQAFMVHMSLLWEGATSWLACLFNSRMIFKRTNKFPQISKWIHYLPGMIPGILLVLTAGIFGILGEYYLSILSLLVAPVGLTVLFLKRQLENTAKITSLK
jgi:cellulose synthase/poly-beta-1,6-N-acetylglucosamine synthase-like glycosyltransferase